MPISLPLSSYLEIGCFLISLFCYKKLKGTPFFWFIPYLAFTVLIESLGAYYAYLRHEKNLDIKNYFLFNIHNHFEVLVPMYMYYKGLGTPVILKLIKPIAITFVLFGLINIFFIQGFFNSYNSNTFVIGGIIVTFLICIYFYECLLPQNLYYNILQEPLFWVSVGFLFFFVGMSVVVSFYSTIVNLKLEISGKRLYFIINQILNVILYSCLSIAFWVCKPAVKK